MTDAKRITPLSEHEARELIQRCYRHGRKIVYTPHGGGQKLFGTVVGTGEKIAHRGGLDHKISGRYLDFTKFRIAPVHGGPEVLRSIDNGSMSAMFPYAGADAAWVTEEDMLNMARILICIGPLPETPFWEGDTVAYQDTTDSNGRPTNPLDHWVVYGIDYQEKDGIDYHAWLKRDGKASADAATCEPSEKLKLIERGNLWKMEHGEPLDFTDIDEEAKFYQSLGMSQNFGKFCIRATSGGVPNEHTGNMEFEFGLALKHIQEGSADEAKLNNKKLMLFALIKYDIEEFGRRMRVHTLAKFGLTENVSV